MKIRICTGLGYLFLYALLVTAAIDLNAQSYTYSRVIYQDNAHIQAFAVAPVADHGYMLTGFANDKGLVFRTDSTGIPQWAKTFVKSSPKASPDMQITCITAVTDSAFVIAGTSYNAEIMQTAVFCSSINGQGDTLWSKQFYPGDSPYAFVVSVSPTVDSGCIMTGSCSTGGTFMRIFATKLDYSGNIEWTRLYAPESLSGWGYGYSVRQTADSGYIITGYYEKSQTYTQNAFLLKLKPDGSVAWAKHFSHTSDPNCSGIDLEIADSGYYCYARKAFFKTDLSGNILWQKPVPPYDYIGNTPLAKLCRTADGSHILILGTVCNYGYQLMKIDPAGRMKWINRVIINAFCVTETDGKDLVVFGNGPVCGVKKRAGNLEVGIYRLDSLGQGDCVWDWDDYTAPDSLAGVDVTYSIKATEATIENSVSYDITPVALQSEPGCVTTAGIIEDTDAGDIRIRVFPNPSQGTLELDYFIGSGRTVQFELYDCTGRKVLLKELDGREGHCKIDCGGLPGGIYIYRVINGSLSGGNHKIIIL